MDIINVETYLHFYIHTRVIANKPPVLWQFQPSLTKLCAISTIKDIPLSIIPILQYQLFCLLWTSPTLLKYTLQSYIVFKKLSLT